MLQPLIPDILQQTCGFISFLYYCASTLNVTPVFCRLVLNVLFSIKKEISEMNLDIDRVFGLFFSLKYILYRLGLDGISACFCLSTLS